MKTFQENTTSQAQPYDYHGIYQFSQGCYFTSGFYSIASSYNSKSNLFLNVLVHRESADGEVLPVKFGLHAQCSEIYRTTALKERIVSKIENLAKHNLRNFW